MSIRKLYKRAYFAGLIFEVRRSSTKMAKINTLKIPRYAVHVHVVQFITTSNFIITCRFIFHGWLCQVRLEGMRHLLQFPSGDLITCDNWETLHGAVRQAIIDPDTELSVSVCDS